MAKGLKKKPVEAAPAAEAVKTESEDPEDTHDIEVLAKIIGSILIVINIAWLIVIAPAIWNTLHPKF